MRTQYAALLFAWLHAPTSDAFLVESKSVSSRIIRSQPCASLPTLSFVETLKGDSYSIATLLLGTLLDRRAAEVDSRRRSYPDNDAKQEREKQRIEEYVKYLADELDNRYDPTESLLGPLYCTLYSYNLSNPKQEPPLWEIISLQPGNLKGQQYFVNRDYRLSVVNYAEIWGRSVAIRAQATFSPVSNETEKKRNPSPTPSLFEAFFTMKAKSKSDQLSTVITSTRECPETALRSCPDVYNFRTFAAEFKVGDLVWPIPIEGTAQFAVLYADPRLRILLSPTGSESIVGPWEQSGLVAVQVRSDLVTADAVPLDLR